MLPDNIHRQLYLDAMGVQTWMLKTAPKQTQEIKNSEQQALAKPATQTAAQNTNDSIHTADSLQTQAPQARITPELSSADSRQNKPIKHRQPFKADERHFVETISSTELEAENTPGNPELEEIEKAINLCRKCPKRSSRLQPLAGQGKHHNTDVFFISEPPTAEEDRCGYYLPEQSGILMSAMLKSADLSDHYYLTGLLKCHSMELFLTGEDEIQQCFAFLASQIKLLKPKLLVSLGRIPAQFLLHSKQSFNELNNQLHQVNIEGEDYPLIVTCHPGFLLRNPQYKKQSLNDLIKIKQLISRRL